VESSPHRSTFIPARYLHKTPMPSTWKQASHPSQPLHFHHSYPKITLTRETPIFRLRCVVRAPLYIISWLGREKVGRLRLHPKKIMVCRLILTPNSFAKALNDLQKDDRGRSFLFGKYVVKTRTWKKRTLSRISWEIPRIIQFLYWCVCQQLTAYNRQALNIQINKN
jgi:hypothetical protein